MIHPWMDAPRESFRVALHLNNTYEMEGRDPNSFAGVAWRFGKHDRPSGGRPIFGQVCLMSTEGLKRKYDMKACARMVAAARACGSDDAAGGVAGGLRGTRRAR